ncbi:hypothetical protein ABMA70_02635 [Halobacteriovorax sp. XZX-3]|uniref:hypothetical protein n=1 Tax=unclassified Halobacteriovorax TaxID=2639665 RepID=UPI000CD18564|nr:hypothetical protein [Halobacteriovorax sp. DA5]POB14635.1 hypothetical protein C0Z22_05950 [Halobacteriovorax sp. DA5]
MKLIDTNPQSENDVLVMFPAAKNFPVEEERTAKAPTPLNKLIEEFEEQVALQKEQEKRPVMNIPSKEGIESIKTRRSCNTAIEIRLAALEEIEQRLKFYLEDIGTAKRKV